MRRQEEEATDASAPELPPEAETAYKQCDTRYGSMAFRTIQPRTEAGSGLDVVFIHGVCASSYMLRYIHTDSLSLSLSLTLSHSLSLSLSQLGTDGTNCQPPPRAVDRRRWLIVDLLGHGRSALSSDPWAYTMENQAKAVMRVLLAEGVRKMALIAHSLGGVVAVRLVSRVSIFSKSFIYWLNIRRYKGTDF
jgi:pimeloyl-ACP methyl ester carboxylesterase